jgi:hypothetical protein
MLLVEMVVRLVTHMELLEQMEEEMEQVVLLHLILMKDKVLLVDLE